MAELIAEENKTVMMDPSLMDEFTKEWWNLTRMEILQQRRKRRLARGGPTAGKTGGGGATASGGAASGGDA
jgi:hypothetical protein